MKKLLIRTILLLMAGAGLTLLAEQFSASLHERMHQKEQDAYLADIRDNLQARIDRIITNNRNLATQLAAQPDTFNNPAGSELLNSLRTTDPVASISLSRNYKIFHVIPEENNEAIANMDYLLYPENMRSIRRAFITGETVISEPYRLQQTSRPGMIIRTPVALPVDQLGMVSTAVDIQSLLLAAGHQPERYGLLVELHHPEYSDHMVQGDSETFRRLPPGVMVTLPEQAIWDIRSLPRQSDHKSFKIRQDLIRLGGAGLTTLLLVYCLKRHGLLSGLFSSRRKITLRLSLLLLTVTPIVVLIMLFELLYYSSVQQVSQQQLKQQSETLLQQAGTQIQAVLGTPRQAAFNSELFHQDVLKASRSEDILGFFATQLRIQPYLSFLAMANTEGEFYAASRPPAAPTAPCACSGPPWQPVAKCACTGSMTTTAPASASFAAIRLTTPAIRPGISRHRRT